MSQPYWDALREHRIAIQYSPSRGRYVFYPRTLAPGTLADDLRVARNRRRGNAVHLHRRRRPTGPPWADALPQLLAVVEWDVGPRVSTELVDVAPEDIRVGMRVDAGVLRRARRRRHAAALPARRQCLRQCSSCCGPAWTTTPSRSVHGDRTWTWREHLAEAAAEASALIGLADPARPLHVGALLGNTPAMLRSMAAAALGGYVLCGINTTRRGAGLRGRHPALRLPTGAGRLRAPAAARRAGPRRRVT